MTVSASTVKELREKTGAGMLDCKKALDEASGDIDRALDFLRKRGLAKAAKKSSRATAEGTIGFYQEGDFATLLEVNCETDFVVKTDDFQNFVKKCVEILVAQKPSSLEAFLKLGFDGAQNVEEGLTALIAKIGENIRIKQFVCWNGGTGTKIGLYIHAGNKIGALVRFNDRNGKLEDSLAKEVAMHVTAMNPQFAKKGDVSEGFLSKEREIISEQVDKSKPEEIQKKMMEGRLGKVLKEICLEDQVFVKDPTGKLSVAQTLQAVDKQIAIEEFVRFQVGQE